MSGLIEKIKTLMETQGINQAELARRTGLCRPAICQYMSGKVNPKQDNVYLIAKALNTTPNYLLGFEDDVHKQEQHKHEEGRLYVVYYNGCLGYVENICTCDSCKEREEMEIFIHHLSGGYLACVKHHELFDGDTILNAGHSIEELSEQHSDMEMMKLFVDMYHDELLKVKAKGE